MSSSGSYSDQSGGSSFAGQLPAVTSPRTPQTLGSPGAGLPWPGSQTGDEGINLLSFLHSLRRRWLVGSCVGFLIATAVGVALWVSLPVNYEAISLLRVRRLPEHIMSRTVIASSEADYETYRQTQAQLFKSPYVLSAALRRPGIDQLAIVRAEENQLAWLAGEIMARYPDKSEVLQVSMRGEDPEQIKDVVDAVNEAYLEQVVHAERQELLVRLDVLRNQYVRSVNDIRGKREVIFKLAETLGTPEAQSAKTKIELALRDLASLKDRRDRLEGDFHQADMRLVLVQMQKEGSFYVPSKHDIQDELEHDRRYAMIQEEIALIERQLAGSGVGGRGGSGRVPPELLALRKQLDQIRLELLPRVTERLNTRHFGMDEAAFEQALTVMDAERRMLAQRLAQMDKNYQDSLEKVRQMGGASADLLSRLDELESLKSMANSMKSEIDRLEIEKFANPRVEIIQKAVVPDNNDMLVKVVEIVGIAALAFGLTIVCIALWDYQGKRVSTVRDVSAGTGIQVVGSLPALSGLRVGALWPFANMDRRSMEVVLNYSIDSIRTALLYNHADRPLRSVMVTSAHGQEGKTTVASQLAVSLARSGRRTLLIDGDLRNPQQHLVFGLPYDRGLSELLRREADLDDVIQPTAAEGLSLITAGYWDQSSLRAMSNETLRETLAALRQRFEFIVIDSGPVLTGADPLLLGQHADATLVSVRRDVSQMPKVNAACERLRAVGVRVMGVVVNGASAEVRRSDLKLMHQNVAAATNGGTVASELPEERPEEIP